MNHNNFQHPHGCEVLQHEVDATHALVCHLLMSQHALNVTTMCSCPNSALCLLPVSQGASSFSSQDTSGPFQLVNPSSSYLSNHTISIQERFIDQFFSPPYLSFCDPPLFYLYLQPSFFHNVYSRKIHCSVLFISIPELS